MAQLIDETRSTKPQSSFSHQEREIFLPVLKPTRLEPPISPTLLRLHTGRLRFAPPPVKEQDEPAAPVHHTRRIEWVERLFEASWMTLLLACAAECVSRLLWAIQP